MGNSARNQIFIPLVRMTVPVIIGMLITFIFQLADTFFIGKLGVDKLAAMSFTYPVYILFIGLFMGMSSGVSSTVAKSLGEKNITKAKSLAAVSLTFFSLSGLLLGLLGLWFLKPIFLSLGAQGNLLSYLQDYMGILFPGFFLLVGTLIMNSILMAKGIIIRTTLIMGIGGIVNIILDYLLIFGFGDFAPMGIAGAAIATVLSWMVTFAFMAVMTAHEKMISFNSFNSLKAVRNRLGDVLKIGIPAVAAQILNPISVSVLTRLIAVSGASAIASYGIVTKVESLGLTLVLALSVILTPFTARLYGAGESEDIDRVVAYSGRITVYWSLALYLILILWGKDIISIFSVDLEIMARSRLYFNIVGLSLPFFGLSHVTTSIFNGAQMPGLSLKLTMVKSVLLTIPLALLGSLIGIHGIFWGITIANILGAVYAKKLLDKWQRERGSDLSSYNPLMDYIGDIKRVFATFRRGR